MQKVQVIYPANPCNEILGDTSFYSLIILTTSNSINCDYVKNGLCLFKAINSN